ncbi:MAG: trigger factor [Nitrospiraceae bacterium]|nr:trigger factor [Nitrospiraceae bacterium]
MLKSVEDISPTKKRLTIEIPIDAIEEKIKGCLENFKQKATISGFRPGKAPLNIVEKYYGKKAEDEALEKIVPEFYQKSLKEAGIMPVSQPAFDGAIDFKRNNPLFFSLTVEIRPKIADLNYKGLKIKDTPSDVAESDIDAALKHLQDTRAVYEPTDKAVEDGDLVTLDYEIVYGESENEKIAAKDQTVQAGHKGLIKEISESLKGKNAGDTLEVDVTMPANFHMKELAGKKVQAKNTIKTVKKKILPKIDEDFAKDTGYDSLSSLREALKKQLELAKKDNTKIIQKNELLSKLVESHDFEVPEIVLRRELNALAHEKKFSEETNSKDELELEEELKPIATKNAKALMLISTIGDEENIDVTEEEMKNQIIEMSEKLSMSPDDLIRTYLNREGSIEGLRNALYRQKVLDLVLSNAIIERGD